MDELPPSLGLRLKHGELPRKNLGHSLWIKKITQRKRLKTPQSSSINNPKFVLGVVVIVEFIFHDITCISLEIVHRPGGIIVGVKSRPDMGVRFGRQRLSSLLRTFMIDKTRELGLQMCLDLDNPISWILIEKPVEAVPTERRIMADDSIGG